jgi:hypothetical protein
MLTAYDIKFDNGRHTRVMAPNKSIAVVYFMLFFDMDIESIEECRVQIIIEQFNLN